MLAQAKSCQVRRGTTKPRSAKPCAAYWPPAKTCEEQTRTERGRGQAKRTPRQASPRFARRGAARRGAEPTACCAGISQSRRAGLNWCRQPDERACAPQRACSWAVNHQVHRKPYGGLAGLLVRRCVRLLLGTAASIERRASSVQDRRGPGRACRAMPCVMYAGRQAGRSCRFVTAYVFDIERAQCQLSHWATPNSSLLCLAPCARSSSSLDLGTLPSHALTQSRTASAGECRPVLSCAAPRGGRAGDGPQSRAPSSLVNATACLGSFRVGLGYV